MRQGCLIVLGEGEAKEGEEGVEGEGSGSWDEAFTSYGALEGRGRRGRRWKVEGCGMRHPCLIMVRGRDQWQGMVGGGAG